MPVFSLLPSLCDLKATPQHFILFYANLEHFSRTKEGGMLFFEIFDFERRSKSLKCETLFKNLLSTPLTDRHIRR